MFDCVPKMSLLPVKKFALQSSSRWSIIREASIFYTLLPYVCFPFLCLVKIVVVVLDRFFFSFGGQEKVVAGRIRQVVILYSNDGMGIDLGGLNIGHLRWVVILIEVSYIVSFEP